MLYRHRHYETTADKFVALCDKIPSYVPFGALGVFIMLGSFIAAK